MKYDRFTLNGVRWWTRPTFTPLVRTGPFADFPRVCSQVPLIKDLRSKRTLEYTHGTTTWIIRIHKAGSVWRRVGTLIRGSRGRRELTASLAVERTGLPAVPVTALAEWDKGSAVLFEKLTDWSSLEDVLRAAPDPQRVRRYGAFARQAHDVGVLQEDFNPSNVLVRGSEMRLIDYERLDVRPTLTRTQRLRLIAKLIRIPTIGRAGLEPFLDGYLKAGEHRDDERHTILEYARAQSQRDRARLKANCTKENRNFGFLATARFVGHYRKGYPGHDGLSLEEAHTVITNPAGFRLSSHADVIRAWREANLRTLEGGPTPMAAYRMRHTKEGVVVYRAS